MVKVTFDVRSSDAVYLIKFAEMLERSRERGEVENGRGYLNPETLERVNKIKDIIS